jgi:ribosomal protein S18 acetylase RimI-like enzyme
VTQIVGSSSNSGVSQTYGSRAWETPVDSRLMQALVARCWRADWPKQHLHAGDVDWWSVHAFGRTPGLDERIRLWFAGEPDATELIGFAWYGPPNEADLIVGPGDRNAALIGSMIDWVESQIPRFGSIPSSRPGGLDADVVPVVPAGDPSPDDQPEPAAPVGARIWTVAEDAASVRAQTELGFVEGPEPGFVHFTGRIDQLDLAAPDLPDGFSLGTIETDADIAARVVAGHAAFPGSTMSVEKYRFCRTTPLYRPALDTILRAPDGTVAAFALGWLDPLTGAIELEPVGVHPTFHRRGLGRAVCRATLRAARSLGGQEVVIAAERTNPAATGLYGALGLEITAMVAAWRRPALSA